MALVKLANYADASPEAREVFDDIMETRGSDYVNHIWRALAVHPPLLKRFWGQMKQIMVEPTRLDPLTKELIYLAVSITNDCTYCINSHTVQARKKGMDDEILAELNEIVALANAGNRLTSGLQLEVDEVFEQKHKDSKWKVPRSARREAGKRPLSRRRQTGAVGVRATVSRTSKR
jgi:AhpD family alkylhydroperoxidase